MIYIKRTICYFILLVFFNIILLTDILHLSVALNLCAFIALFVFFIYFNVHPESGNPLQKRMKILSGGYELMIAAATCFISEILLYLYIYFTVKIDLPIHILILNAIICAIFTAILLLNGLIRIFTTSSELGVLPRIYLILLWWVPVVNIVLLRKFCKIASKEYVFTSKKYELNNNRKHEEVCKTKYPIIMVHGTFFRDWENYSYWGRIPKELINNGAVIYYGGQQSSASVEQSAEELKQCILNIIEETSCEKVNIIAHSKGGLDSRYAISCLGMGQYVASLTTINTPHMGCNYVKRLLERTPRKLLSSIGEKYESIYIKLGDNDPDFFSSLTGLTDTKCAELNEKMTDIEGVLCQSVGSKMRSRSSAAFPLNIGYRIIKPIEGENDGLVSTKSMVWGNFLGVLTPKGRQGISHGDMIDLQRKSIDGFDVCEFYVDLVNKLKLNGL